MSPTPAFFEHQHTQLGAQLHAHLLDVAGADFGGAQQKLQRWRAGLAQHIEIENTQLLPHVPPGARWAARVYLVEHDRIALLADEYALKVQAVADQPPQDEQDRRAAVLMLLDAAHALRHVLEHHHAREEQALAHELPAALQAAAWAGTEPGGAAR
ncbi:hypothetical protein [Diaphorobacter sp.]|uniref:hypothetical protein n=1 Tax=Diaphorobacter sp. TaxID=1934310 RepID=UPI003D14F64F